MSESAEVTLGVQVMKSPFFSVVVCTRNRAAYLSDMVASLRAQDYPPDAYEIIVVDNASTDNTRQVVDELNCLGGKRIRYIQEPTVGLLWARNTGAQVAQGNIIAYADDDAIAEENWLTSLCEVYEADDEVACVGGKIQVLWPNSRPDWLPKELETNYGALDLGDEIRTLDYPLHPNGGNFSVRRDVLVRLGGFAVGLGLFLYNDEKELCYRIWKSGGKIVYAPKAIIYHKVLPERVNRTFVLKRGYWQGISNAIFEQSIAPVDRRSLFRRGLVELKGALLTTLVMARDELLGRQRWSFVNRYDLCYIFGHARQKIYIALLGKEGFQGQMHRELGGDQC